MKRTIITVILATLLSATSCMRGSLYDNDSDTDLLKSIYDIFAVNVVITSSQTNATNLSPITLTITFADDVTGFADTDIIVGNATLSNFAVVSPRVYTVDVTPAADGEVTVDIPKDAAQDANGNPSRASRTWRIIYDTIVNPFTSVAIQSNNTNMAWAKLGDTITVTFLPGERIQTPTVTINGTTATVTPPGTFGTAWRATYVMTNTDPEAPVTFTISNILDLVGNAAADISATTDASTVTYDMTPPAITTHIGRFPDDANLASLGDDILLVITSTEDIQYPTVTISGHPAIIAGSGTTYTADYYMTATDPEGLIAFSISNLRDLAGNTVPTINGPNASDATFVTYDRTRPSVIAVSAASLSEAAVGPVSVTLTFDSPMDTAVNPSPTITGLATPYTITGSTWAAGDTQWTGSFTLNDDNEIATGVYNISGFSDRAGNIMGLTTSYTVAVNTASPAVTGVSVNSLRDADAGPVSVSISFNMVMDPATNPSPTITGLVSGYTITGSSWSVGNTVWTGNFTFNDNNETNTGTYNIAGFRNSVGNLMALDSSFSVGVDTTNPQVAGVSVASLLDPDVGAVSVTITFDRPMDPATNPSPTITGLTHSYTITGSAWTVGNTQWTGSFTLIDDNETLTGTYNISGFRSGAGNLMAPNSTYTVAVDTNSPGVAGVSVTSLDDSDAGSVSVTINFDQVMDPATNPSPTITGLASAYTITGAAWSAGDTQWTGSFTFNDNNETAVGTYNISGFRNAGGNMMLPNTAYTVAVDTRNPSVVAVDVLTLRESNVGSVAVTIAFDEAMNTSVNPSPTITGLASPYTITGSSWAAGNTEWTGTFTFNDNNEFASGTYNISGFQDAAGNSMTPDSSHSVAVDTTNPSVNSVSVSSLTDANVGNVSVAIDFNMAMDPATNPSPTITGLVSTYTISGSSWSLGNTRWTGTFNFTDNNEANTGTYNISGFRSASGNFMLPDGTHTVAANTISPAVTGVSVTSLNDTNVGMVNVTITFNMAMDPATNPSPTISGLASPYTITGSSWAAGDTQWTGSFTFNDNNEIALGTYNISGFRNAGGNLMAPDATRTVAVNTTTPQVTGVSVATLNESNVGPVSVTITFNQAMDPATNPSPTITGLASGYTIAGSSWAAGNTQWTGSFLFNDNNEIANGTYNISGFRNAGSNMMLPDSTHTVAVNTTSPGVTGVSIGSLNDSNVGMVNVTITFNQAMDPGTNPSPTIAGLATPYTISGSTWTVGNTQWTGSFIFNDDNEGASGTYQISGFRNTAGNMMLPDNAYTVAVYTINPVVTGVNVVSLNDTNVGLVNVTITFNMAMDPATNPSPTITGLVSAYTITGSSWAAGDTEWTGSFTFNDNNEIALGIYNISGFRNAGGNMMAPDATRTVAVNTTTPQVTGVSVATLNESNVGPVSVTITFDQAMDPATNPSPTITGLASGYTIAGSSWAAGNTQWTGSFLFNDNNEIANGTYNISGFRNAGSNMMLPDSTHTVAVNTTSPGVTGVSVGSLNDSNVGVVNVTITFDMAMDTGANPSPTIAGLATPYTISGSTWTVGNTQWTGSFIFNDDNEGASGTYQISGFRNAAGNMMLPNNAYTVAVYTINPVVAGVNVVSLNDTNVGVVNVTITFNTAMNTSINPSPTITGLASAYTITGSSWAAGDTQWTGSFTFNDNNEIALGTYNISGFRNAGGNLMTPDATRTVAVNTTTPQVTGVSVAALNESNVGPLSVTITFDQAMDPATNPSPTITGLASGYTITGSSWAVGNTEWTGSFNFNDDNEIANGTYNISGFRNAGSNMMLPDSSFTVAVNTTSPGVTGVSVGSLNDSNVGVVNVTITFDMAMDTGANPSPTIAGLASAYTISGSSWAAGNTQWTGSFVFNDNNEGASGTYQISGFRNTAGNMMLPDNAYTVAVYTINPVVTGVNVVSLNDTNVGLVNVTITFNTAMNTSINPSPTITGLASAYTITGSSWAAGDTQWTGSFTFNDNNETATGTYNISGFRNAGGNLMAPDVTHTVAVNTQAPHVTGVSVAALNDSNVGPVSVTITFDQAMDPATNPSPTITGLASGYTITGSSWAVGNTEWTGSFTFNDDNEIANGTYNISGFQNAGANMMLPDNTFTVAANTTNPAVSGVSVASLEDADVGNINVTVTFDQAMDPATNPSPTITGLTSGYTITGSSWAAGDTQWTGSFTFNDNNEALTGTYQISAFRNTAGNLVVPSSAYTVDVDTRNPQVSNVSVTSLNNSNVGNVSVSITFDEQMNTGTNPSPTITGLASGYTITGSSWSAGDTVWTGTFTFVDDDEQTNGTYNISGFVDTRGNMMAPDIAHTVAVDTLNPQIDSVSITVLNRSHLGQTLNVDVHFDAAMNTSLSPFGSFIIQGVNTHTVNQNIWTDNQTWQGTFTLDGLLSAEDNIQGISSYFHFDGADGFEDANGNDLLPVDEPVLFDTKRPGVGGWGSYGPYNESNLGNAIVGFNFDEPIDTGVAGSLTVTGLSTVPSYTVTQTSFDGTNWAGSFTLMDYDEDTSGAMLNISGFQDMAGNVIQPSGYGIIEVHTSNPNTALITMRCLSIPVTRLTDDHVGQTVEMEILFNQVMNDSETPSLTIGALTRGYTITTSSWPTDQTWRGTFVFEDDNEPNAGVTTNGTISITGFHNSWNNDIQSGITHNISVDTKNPEVTDAYPSMLNATHKGASIDNYITFSEPMNTSIMPTVQVFGLQNMSPYTAVFSSWSGNTIWIGNYTLYNGDQEQTGNYSITGAVDANGNPMVPSLSYAIAADTMAPTIFSATSSSPNNTYIEGQPLNLTLTFSEPVSMSLGNLQVVLNSGRTLNLTGISGATHSENFTVNSPETTLGSNLRVDSAAFFGGSLMDAAGNPMSDFSILPANNLAGRLIIVDATVPEISSIVTLGMDPVYGIGESVSIQINFSEVVNLVGTLTVSLNTNGSTGTATINSFSGSQASCTYTVLAGQYINILDVIEPNGISLSGTFTDGAGHNVDLTVPSGANLSDDLSMEIDGIAPKVNSITGVPATGGYNNGDPVVLSVEFSENVTLSGGGQVDLALNSTGTAAITTCAGTTCLANYTVGPTDNAAVLTVNSITVSAGTLTDAAGNGLDTALPSGANLADTSTIVVDTTVPTIEYVDSSFSSGTYGLGAPVSAYVRFSEPVTISVAIFMRLQMDSTWHDLTILPGTAQEFTCFTYNIQAGDEAADLNVDSLQIGAATIRDPGGNDAILTIPAGFNLADRKNIKIDINGPSITAAETMDANGDGRLDHYRITFNEPVLDSSFGVLASFNVAGYFIEGLSTGTIGAYSDTANDAVIYLRFTPIALPDTGAKPLITTSAAGAITDIGGNQLAKVDAAHPFSETDKAPPRVESLVALVNLNSIEVRFTEPVDNTGGDSICNSGADFNRNTFTYDDVNTGSASSLSSTMPGDNACSDAKVIILTGAGFSANDMGADLLRTFLASATKMYDNGDNAAEDAAYTIHGLVDSATFYFDTKATGANTTADVNNFPLLLRLKGDVPVQSVRDGAPDIRFCDDNGTFLPYQIERWDKATSKAEVWVLIPTVLFNSTSDYVRMYYNDKTDGSVPGMQESESVFGTGNQFAGVWHMNEADGLTILDSTANKNNSFARTTTRSADELIGGTQYFNDTTSISIAHHATLNGNGGGGLMISAWAKHFEGEMNEIQGIVAKQDHTGFDDGYSFYTQTMDERAYLQRSNANLIYSNLSGTIDTDWDYYVVYLDNSATGSIYFNGVAQALADSTISTVWTNTSALYFGRFNNFVASYTFQGSLDEIRIENTWRGQNWIKLCYANQKPDQNLVKDPWFNPAWQYRIKITVPAAMMSGTYSNFPLAVNLDCLPTAFFSHVRSDGFDIVVTAGDGLTKLPRELVWINTGTEKGELYFRAPQVTSASDVSFYIYYGNAAIVTNDNSTDVWSNGYAAVWHLQSGGTAEDSTANNNDGAVTTGGGGYVIGVLGNGLNCDGAATRVTVSGAGNLAMTAPLTMSAWTVLDAGSILIEQMPILSKMSGSGTAGYSLNIDPVATSIVVESGNSGDTAAMGSMLAVAGTYCFTGTINTGPLSASTYYNLVNSTSDSSIDAPVTDSNDFYIGYSDWYLFYPYFDGIIDEVRMSSVARPSSWLTTEYNNIQYNRSIFLTYYTVGTEQSH